MEAISVSNFRCFREMQQIALRPLTILVGENSAGKTSFLAATRLAWDAAFGSSRIDFNEEPFPLGAYSQIAHFRGGRAGRADSFEVCSYVTPRAPRQLDLGLDAIPAIRVTTSFQKAGSQPVIGKQTLEFAGYELSADFPDPKLPPTFGLKTMNRQVNLTRGELGSAVRFRSQSSLDWHYVIYLFIRAADLSAIEDRESSEITSRDRALLEWIARNMRPRTTGRPVGVAPVRTRPLRTYNPISATPLPEGDHVPMLMAKTYFEDKEKWLSLEAELRKFGSESGLFHEIGIRPLGEGESDPFQLRVKFEGPRRNLVDVGYGVSQVLPILVDSLLAGRGETFLLQQPEVHLHPRAQAALGTFLARLAARHGKRFIIETHSDFLVDRVREEVRRGRGIKPDDVSILYFSRDGIEAHIHPIEIDPQGNLVGVPDDYRRFFLEEERRLLGLF